MSASLESARSGTDQPTAKGSPTETVGELTADRRHALWDHDQNGPDRFCNRAGADRDLWSRDPTRLSVSA
jgi:hypothetical protein